MIRLTNLADYAVVVMAALARASGRRASVATIACASNVPAPTVAKLAGALGRGGLLVATRGVAGGFALSRSPAEITLADIVEAIDGPISLVQCATPSALSGGPSNCAMEGSCCARPHWGLVNARVRAALAGVSLAEVAGIVPAKQVAMATMEIL